MQYSQKYPEEGVAPLKAEEPAAAYRTECSATQLLTAWKGVKALNEDDQLRIISFILSMKPMKEPDIQSKFEESYQRWKQETWMFSSPRKLTSHPDFQAIVNMGKDAVPCILDKLEAEPSPLVWALNRIYDCRISEGKYLTIPELAQKWLQILRP